jgi:hypothetical protein
MDVYRVLWTSSFPLLYPLNPHLSSIFQTVFGGFHYAIFICIYIYIYISLFIFICVCVCNALWSFSHPCNNFFFIEPSLYAEHVAWQWIQRNTEQIVSTLVEFTDYRANRYKIVGVGRETFREPQEHITGRSNLVWELGRFLRENVVNWDTRDWIYKWTMVSPHTEIELWLTMFSHKLRKLTHYL